MNAKRYSFKAVQLSYGVCENIYSVREHEATGPAQNEVSLGNTNVLRGVLSKRYLSKQRSLRFLESVLSMMGVWAPSGVAFRELLEKPGCT